MLRAGENRRLKIIFPKYEQTFLHFAGVRLRRLRSGGGGRGFRAELSEQPGAAGAESLCRTAAGRRQGEGVARGDARTAAFGRHGPHGRALPRGDGAAQRLAGRRRRPVGARPVLDRRTAAAGLAARRRGAQGEGPAVDRVDSAKSARGRLFRPGDGLSGRIRPPAEQFGRLVAADGGAENPATVLLRDERPAGDRLYDALFPVSVEDAARQAAGTLVALGRLPCVRQPASGLLAL